jgi:hypothetical protein
MLCCRPENGDVGHQAHTTFSAERRAEAAAMSQSTQLALRNQGEVRWHSADWRRLWLSIQQQPWRSLALVPAGVGAPLDATVHIATALARTGMKHVGAQIHVADATDLRLEDMADLGEHVRECTETGLVIVALAPVQLNPVTVALAQASDRAVLCVLLDQMRASDAKHTTDEIGHEHFIGAVTLG